VITRKHARFDTLHMGRSCIDLYSNDSGAPFSEIRSFGAYVGGSPTNMSVGVRRLGHATALLTAVGADPVGEFVLAFLRAEGVETGYIPVKQGRRTSAVLLGIQPPDMFPLVYYRENCADIQLTIDDVIASPITDCRVFEFAGTNLSREPSLSSTLFACEAARDAGATVVFDVDFRPDQWTDPRSFGVVVRSALHVVDIVIGTRDELNAIMIASSSQMELRDSAVSDTRVSGEVERAVEVLHAGGVPVVIEKTGSRGCRIHRVNCAPVDVPGFPVPVVNILGAGDAFGAGFLSGLLNGESLERAARLGNACGAIVVTRHACSASMPTREEVDDFVAGRGGL
jgi:5-dehydro-2-deoxygluconokinase